MHTVKAAEPESIRQPAQRAPAPNRPQLEGLACINSKKWDKGVISTLNGVLDRTIDERRIGHGSGEFSRSAELRVCWARARLPRHLRVVGMGPMDTVPCPYDKHQKRGMDERTVERQLPGVDPPGFQRDRFARRIE